MAGDGDDFKITLKGVPDIVLDRMAFYRKKNRDGLVPQFLADADAPDRPYIRLSVREGTYGHPLTNKHDPNDRCELRELAGREQKAGTAVYYGFSLRIPPDFKPEPERCVVAQVKMAYAGCTDYSPVFSLRVDAGRYVATIEQLYLAADKAAGRYLHDLAPDGTCPPGTVLAEDDSDFVHPESTRFQIRVLLAAAPPGLPEHLALKNFVKCTDGVQIVQGPARLPADPGEWHDFVVFIGATGRPDARGLIALYVDGQLIASASGIFGVPTADNDVQYFKVGPYRNDNDAVWGDKIATVDVRDIWRSADMPDPLRQSQELIA